MQIKNKFTKKIDNELDWCKPKIKYWTYVVGSTIYFNKKLTNVSNKIFYKKKP